MSKLVLTTEEKNVLDKLTHANKMDCWFWIDDARDCIIDLENGNTVLDTCEAILEVDDGTPDASEFLDSREFGVYENLVKRARLQEIIEDYCRSK